MPAIEVVGEQGGDIYPGFDKIRVLIKKSILKGLTMEEQPFGFIDLPNLNPKPREAGITMILDKGTGLSELDDCLSIAAPYIDLIKFGWATSRLLSRSLLKEKIEKIVEKDIDVCPGGTFVELAIIKDCVDRFFAEAKDIGFTGIELSDGMIDLPLNQRKKLIKKAVSCGFKVTTEVGKKEPDEDSRLDIDTRVATIKNDLESGAWKVIIEARESGTLGIFKGDGSVKSEYFHKLYDLIDPNSVIFEAPQKKQQAWLIKEMGPYVNLGNIALREALPLATLRHGLRGDTLRDYHKAERNIRIESGIKGAKKAARRGDVIVVIDALRASATILAALKRGASAIVPADKKSECLGKLSAGEVGGVKIPEFTFSNSPTELMKENLEGKKLWLLTSNGTRCIHASGQGGSAILIGHLLNARAVAREADKLSRKFAADITLLAVGRNDQESVEDIMVASEIVYYLPHYPLIGKVKALFSGNLEKDFLQSESGQNLIKLGAKDDVLYCVQKNIFDLVPIYTKGEIILSSETGL